MNDEPGAPATTADDPRGAAIKRLNAKRELRQNLVAYLIINAALIAIWAVSGGGYFWPGWVLAGWGIGLAFHAWNVYGQKPISEDEIQREIERGRGS